MTSSEEEERRQRSRGIAAFSGYYDDDGNAGASGLAAGRKSKAELLQQQQTIRSPSSSSLLTSAGIGSSRRRASGSGSAAGQRQRRRPSDPTATTTTAASPSPPERQRSDAGSVAPAGAASVGGEKRSPVRGTDFRRYSVPENSYNKSMELDSETSDSEDGDDIDVESFARMKLAEFCDTKQFENLQVSSEVKELFHNVIRYTPQKIDLQYKLVPFIPDYIPAVGDIDAFLKVPRPDGVADRAGLHVLDEPATEQSEPAVLHLQLRSKTRSAAGASKDSVVKRLADAPKHGRHIDKWIEDMGQLHRSKHPPAVQLRHKFPSSEMLLQPWPADVEAKLLLDPPAGILDVDCDLPQLVDLACGLFDVPVYEGARIESLHTLFALYTEVHNVDIQRIHNF